LTEDEQKTLIEMTMNEISAQFTGIEIGSYPCKRRFSSFIGKILRIHPSLNVATRSGIVEIVLDPAPPGALPGQLCRVKLQSPPQPRLLIPFSALRRDQEGEFVFVVNEENKAIRTTVHSGLRIQQKIEILDGLKDGQRVIVKGFLGLKHGTPVRTATQPGSKQKAARD
jgi:membrane fusion protein (multidrug efflux system)